MIKRVAAALCALFIMLSLTSCGGLFTDPAALMRPPEAYGALAGIEEALSAAVGTDFSYEYPVSGDYRTAYIQKDINRDGNDEAIVFYSLNSEPAVMRMNYMVREDDAWTSAFDITLAGTGIDRIAFADLYGDKAYEILLGSRMYNTSENQLNIYTLSENTLTVTAQETYTQLCVCSLIDDDKSQLLLLNIGTKTISRHDDAANAVVENYVSAKLVSLNIASPGVETIIGTVGMDSNITAFSDIKTGMLDKNTNAVFIDAMKGSEVMITELIYYDNTLCNAFFNEQLGETALTRREAPVNSRDIDNDGIIEIPETYLFHGYENAVGSDRVYYTVWKRFNGQRFKKSLSGVINTVDGYFLQLPTDWLGRVTLSRILEEKTRVFCDWDFTDEQEGEELFRIKVFGQNDFAESNEGYEKVAEDDKFVYGVKINKNNNKSENVLNEKYFMTHLLLI